MTMFIKIENGQPVGYAVVEDNLRALFPNHQFPQIFTPESVAPLGFGIFEWTQIPQVNYPNKVVETTPVLRENGIYYQSWSVSEMNNEEKLQATIAQSVNVRNMRNNRLYGCDWTQVVDAPVDQAAWATYRQALRDVPSQAGFPWDVQWPIAPA